MGRPPRVAEQVLTFAQSSLQGVSVTKLSVVCRSAVYLCRLIARWNDRLGYSNSVLDGANDGVPAKDILRTGAVKC